MTRFIPCSELTILQFMALLERFSMHEEDDYISVSNWSADDISTDTSVVIEDNCTPHMALTRECRENGWTETTYEEVMREDKILQEMDNAELIERVQQLTKLNTELSKQLAVITSDTKAGGLIMFPAEPTFTAGEPIEKSMKVVRDFNEALKHSSLKLDRKTYDAEGWVFDGDLATKGGDTVNVMIVIGAIKDPIEREATWAAFCHYRRMSRLAKNC